VHRRRERPPPLIEHHGLTSDVIAERSYVLAMVREIARPLFLVVWIAMWLTAATELGPGS